MQKTKAEFAAENDVDYPTASGFIKFLEKRGLVKNVGLRANPGGKGKPSEIYEISNTITITFSDNDKEIREPVLKEKVQGQNEKIGGEKT